MTIGGVDQFPSFTTLMSGNQGVESHFVAGVTVEWTTEGDLPYSAGDYSNDGVTDVGWHNTDFTSATGGTVAIWNIQDGQLTSQAFPATATDDWQLIA